MDQLSWLSKLLNEELAAACLRIGDWRTVSELLDLRRWLDREFVRRALEA